MMEATRAVVRRYMGERLNPCLKRVWRLANRIPMRESVR